MKKLTIDIRDESQRLDRFLGKYLKKAPAGFIYRMLRKKNITLNGRRATGSERIAAGDIVCLFLSDETIAGFGGADPSEKRDAAGGVPRDAGVSGGERADAGRLSADGLTVLLRTEEFLAVCKPPGWLTQKAEASVPSLTEIVRTLPGIGGEDSTYRPSPANRLDRNTSGIVLFGLTLPCQQFLAEQLRGRGLRKEYLAIVHGSFGTSGVFRVYYTKDERRNLVTLSDTPVENGGEMVTEFMPLCRSAGYTLVRAGLLTGKSHQIRAHLSHLGYPIAGDPKYGDRRLDSVLRDRYGTGRQMLHAWKVTFPDISGRYAALSGVCLTAPVPADMRHLMNRLGLSLPED